MELFSGVKTLKIVHTWRENLDGLPYIKRCLDVDVDGPAGVRARSTAEPKNWRVAFQTADHDHKKITKLFLVGMNARKGREVGIECVAVSKEDLNRYSEQSYGWLVTQSRARVGAYRLHRLGSRFGTDDFRQAL